MVKLYTRQSLHTTTQLLQGSRELQPKFGKIIHKTKSTYYNTATPRLQGTTAKIWSNYTQDKVYILQHSYSKAPVKLQPNFCQIIHKTKSTYYNTATPRLHWNYSQNLVKLYTRQSLHTTTQLLQGSSETTAKSLVKLYTRQSLHTTTQLLQGSSGTTAKVWSNYTQDKAYTLQHSYSKAPVKLEPNFGQIIHKTTSTYYNTATPRLQGTTAKIWSNYTQDKVYILQHSYSKAPGNYSQNLVKLYTRQSLHTTTQLFQGSSGIQPKFGQIIHKTKSTYYNTATPRLQWNYSQNLVK